MKKLVPVRTRRATLIRRALLAAAVLGIAGLVALVGFVAPNYFLAGPARMPEVLRQAGVKSGPGVLRKELLFEDAGLGLVHQLIPRSGGQVDVVGALSYAAIGPTGDRVRGVKYLGTDALANRMEMVDADGDGAFEFFQHPLHTSAVLMDATGARMWAYPPAQAAPGESGIYASAAGDLDGDGRVEFVLAPQYGKALVALDLAGKVRWRRDLRPEFESAGAPGVTMLAVLDKDHPGAERIVQGSSQSIGVRSGDGSLLRQTRLHSLAMQLVRWPDADSGWRLMLAQHPSHVVYELDGTSVAKVDLPEAIWRDFKATAVRFNPSDDWFAVISEGWQRTQLYVVTSGGKVIYQEVLDEPCASVAATGPVGGQALLVGGRGRVWKYTMRE